MKRDKTRDYISEFEYTLSVPDNKFKKFISKEIKVGLFKNGNTWHAGLVAGRIYFEVTIPKYLRDFLLNTYKEYMLYNVSEEHGENKKKLFTNKLYTSSLVDMEDYFSQMTRRALFLKTLEVSEKKNKVIFISSSSLCKDDKDSLNFASMNKKLNLSFQFFVAYEIENKHVDGLVYKNKHQYFGIERIGDNYDDEYKSTRLPLFFDSTVAKFRKIKWSQEREEYLTSMQDTIIDLQTKIHSFVDGISEKSIDQLMLNTTIKKLIGVKQK